MAFLSLSNISKVFGSTAAVEDFNLEVEKGEFVSFLGPSGCGKTTTLRMIAGFELPTTGSITLDGEDITYKSPNQRNVGMVFQSYALFPNLTIGQNIGFGLQVRKVPEADIKKKVDEMLNLVHLESHINKYPYQLSGGQQQRIALTRALAINPRVLLLDEPLSALDAKIRVELRLEIRRIQQTMGITTIYVTHDQEEALLISDRVVVMSQGLMEQVGTPANIYNFPSSEFVAQFVGQLNMLPVTQVDLKENTCVLAGQKVKFEHSPERKISDSPRLAIRPEELQIGTGEGRNALKGKVESVLFLGAIVRLRVDVGGVMLSADFFNERTRTLPRVGDDVIVSFPEYSCWMV
ncbi:MAG: spermidine/putrescine ABC transporter ATP-binding protein [Anaerolinea sp.]|nr:spermidine/putrescine ABC transporter ATP-binding protein [Anaerolinea sp.]